MASIHHQQQQQQQQAVPWQGFDDHIIIGGSTSPNRAHQGSEQSIARPQSRRFTETFRGFIKDPLDAQLCIEACIEGLLQPLNMVPMSLSDLQIRSGTVLVFAENSNLGQMVRWRDGCRWSASRLQGPFLLYREVESATTPSTNTVNERDIRFVNTVVRGKTRFVANGLAKRTLTLSGSDGNRYRVISYFYPCHVQHLYGDPVANSSGLSTPSSMPEYARFSKRGGALHPFSMPDLSYSALLRNSTNAQAAAAQFQQQQQQKQLVETTHHRQSNQSTNQSIQSIHATTSISKKHSKFTSPPSNASPKVMTPQSEDLHASPNHGSTVQVKDASGSDCECECECGGLGSKRHFNYFETNPFWTEFPVTLAPISKR
ncbi:Gti1/Pac2 family-domain-containing protein [Chytriomyces cf. hyalinus JEL632]|nr:Gti1/Pac2 family-domain-containing protein [Chytriomyces cf. hyalinus JEL632]